MDSYKNRRLQAIKNLGSECVCCRERCHWVLQFDHKNGDGSVHRSDKNVTSFFIMTQLAAGRDLDRFQLLCANCHAIKTKYARIFKKNPPNSKIIEIRNQYAAKAIMLRPLYPKGPSDITVNEVNESEA